MNLFQIAWRNIRYRSLASILTIVSMALGVGLCVLVLSISGVLNTSLQRNSNVGYNLIVGSKGAATQLVFNTVFYLDKPIENLPYDFYLEFLTAEQRNELVRKVTGESSPDQKAGRYSMFVAGGFAIPVAMGDYIEQFRLVSTTPDYFEKLRYGEAADQEYRFAAGRNFKEKSEEHGFFEAVIGSQVASALNLGLGDKIYASHGPGGFAHTDPFTVVGILAPTGTPNDRAAFANLEGFFLLEGHVKPKRDDQTGIQLEEDPAELAKIEAAERLPLERREVTAILVRTSPFGVNLDRSINKSPRAQAVSPIQVITQLLELFVRPVQRLLLLLTLLVVLVSAISILVSIYNSMNERTRDIAVMRALGASRDQVMLVIFGESLLITLIGAVLGVLAGKGVATALSPYVESYTGIRIPFFAINWPYEPLIIAGLIFLGTLAGLIPAVAAYRTNVAKHL